MREFIDVTGKTEEEAIKKALDQLNMDRFDVSIEVLERAKSGFLGIGAAPAKVRVFYGEEELEVTPAAPVAPVAPAAPAVEKPQQPRKEQKKNENKPRREKTKPAEKKVEKVEVKAEVPAAPVVLGEEVDDEKAKAIKAFLSGLLKQMDAEAEIKVYLPEKGRYKVIL